jgi:hypothetical protein
MASPSILCTVFHYQHYHLFVSAHLSAYPPISCSHHLPANPLSRLSTISPPIHYLSAYPPLSPLIHLSLRLATHFSAWLPISDSYSSLRSQPSLCLSTYFSAYPLISLLNHPSLCLATHRCRICTVLQ